jgi:hypothetical protein
LLIFHGIIYLAFLFKQSEIEIDNETHIPRAAKLMSAINDDILENAFHFSFKSADHNFLSIVPPGDRCSIKTTLRNLIANASHSMLKHEYMVDHVKEKDVRKFIYDLDSMTPTKYFTAPARPDITRSGGKHRHTSKRRLPLTIEMALSDGEVEEITLV